MPHSQALVNPCMCTRLGLTPFATFSPFFSKATIRPYSNKMEVQPDCQHTHVPPNMHCHWGDQKMGIAVSCNKCSQVHSCYILTWQSFWSERRKGIISSYTPCSVNAAVNWGKRSPGQCFQKLTTRAATILCVALFPASICLRPSESCVRGLSLSPWHPNWEASNPSAL